jgi:hypothetical protein
MSGRRLGALVVVMLGLASALGAGPVGAAAGTTILKFHDTTGSFTGIGFNANDPNAVPPIGGSFVISIKLENIGTQFGKPSGTTVGRVLLECTVLAENSPGNLDGNCSGIAHVPNGFFTFEGNGGLTNAKVNRFAITGGVGPYANDRGQIKVVNNADGSSNATVMLSP